MNKKKLRRNTFLYKIYLYYFWIKYKIMPYKKSYSQLGEDVLINNFFKKFKGRYVDIGCFNPIKYNNTMLLYLRGWQGTNIDLNPTSIDLFNLFRKNDLNINLAVSSKKTELEYINFHDKSPINKIKTTFNKDLHPLDKIKKIKSDTLDSIIENSKYKDKKIDFVSIDVEGYEIEVIKGFNLKKYKPSIIVIEYLDTSLRTIEIKNFNLQNIINSEIYKLMIKYEYHMVNWLHSDLIFAHNSFIEN